MAIWGESVVINITWNFVLYRRMLVFKIKYSKRTSAKPSEVMCFIQLLLTSWLNTQFQSISFNCKDKIHFLHKEKTSHSKQQATRFVSILTDFEQEMIISVTRGHQSSSCQEHCKPQGHSSGTITRDWSFFPSDKPLPNYFRGLL